MIKIYIRNKLSQLEGPFRNFACQLMLIYSREMARIYRRQIVKRNGRKVLNRRLKKSIKLYSKQNFGKKSYWPYLALYTEIRGEFIRGWIPYDYYRYKLLPVINPPNYRHLGDTKTYDHKIFEDFAIKPLFVFISGMLLDADFDRIDLTDLNMILSEYNDVLVIKEEFGRGGKQVTFVHSLEFSLDMLNAKINYVIQPYMKQYKLLNELYPGSLNTFRVTTYLRKDGSIEIKFVTLRFGVDGQKVDNISSGGQYLFFNAKGEPSKYSYYGEFGCFSGGDRHKNTNFLFSDIKIPMYKEILNRCKSAHKKYPYVRLIGWDVFLDHSGNPKLIEWNAFRPGFWQMEALFGPIFAEADGVFNVLSK
jgi:hypothetical protein